jgi:prefoldin subunit 5
VERGAAMTAVETRAADLDARIEVAGHKVADLDTRVSQIDAAIAEATRRVRTTSVMTLAETQRRGPRRPCG